MYPKPSYLPSIECNIHNRFTQSTFATNHR